jgi:hypothetical protein
MSAANATERASASYELPAQGDDGVWGRSPQEGMA